MTKEIEGVNLVALEEPIHEALKAFQKISNGSIVFDLDNAPKLELTPEKPNSARSATAVQHLGETIGNLYVIAFAPFDGTGDENTYTTNQILSSPDWLPLEPKVIPRSKSGIHSEVHLPLVGQFVSRTTEPALHAGHLDLISINQQWGLQSIGGLGQSATPCINALESGRPAEPYVRFTTGFHADGKRFGDPHAVYNGFPNVVQVAGFLAVTDEMSSRHSGLPEDLQARLPVWYVPCEQPASAA